MYSRFSSELQSDDSIADQIAVCRRWAERSGHEVVAAYEDRAISGTKRTRPGLQLLLDEVERTKGKAFRAVLVESQSRLSRDLVGALELIFRDLGRHGVRLLNASSFDSTSESGERQAVMGSLINATYVRQLAKMPPLARRARTRRPEAARQSEEAGERRHYPARRGPPLTQRRGSCAMRHAPKSSASRRSSQTSARP